LNLENNKTIMTPECVAQFLHKSISWVYKYWKELGGVKLGGSLLFPTKEELYERIFKQEERVEIRLHPERKQIHESVVSNKERGNASRSKKKRGGEQSETSNDEPNTNRHGLLGTGE
jgi:hypothetical protein